MKLTKDLLIRLIKETMEHGGLSCAEVHPIHTHNEWEDHKKEEEKKTKAMAKISIKPTTKLPAPLQEGDDDNWARKAIERTHVDKDELRDILKKWAEKEYESDEHRWQEYAADIEDLVAEPLSLGSPQTDPLKKLKPRSMGGPLEET